MSNCLTISVMKFEDVVSKEVSYGFVAGDSYGKDFEDGFPSLADFLQVYPTAEALQEHVLSLDPFNVESVEGVGGSGTIDMNFPEG